jgi:hypothetical protein
MLSKLGSASRAVASGGGHHQPGSKTWREDPYDVVVLGATHWVFNAGATRSHLDENLEAPVPPPPRTR